MLAPQPVKPVPTKSTGPRPGWGGSLDLNEENDRRALITARMYGLVIARRNSGSIAFGRAKAPHKLVDQIDERSNAHLFIMREFHYGSIGELGTLAG